MNYKSANPTLKSLSVTMRVVANHLNRKKHIMASTEVLLSEGDSCDRFQGCFDVKIYILSQAYRQPPSWRMYIVREKQERKAVETATQSQWQ